MTLFNDTSSPLALLATRRSGKARDMTAPGPDDAQLRDIIARAARVPDHGKLAPWRFVVIGADDRTALADLIEAAYVADKPEAGRTERQAMRDFAFQAPTLIVLMSRPNSGSHIPLWEQELSVGAAAMALLTSAHAMGFVGNWLTGWPAYSEAVRDALGEPGERIAGFFFIGTPARALDERPRPELATVMRTWVPGA